MNSHTLSKLAILAAAFLINGVEFAGVNYLFSTEMQQRSGWVSLALAGAGTEHAVMRIAKAMTSQNR